MKQIIKNNKSSLLTVFLLAIPFGLLSSEILYYYEEIAPPIEFGFIEVAVVMLLIIGISGIIIGFYQWPNNLKILLIAVGINLVTDFLLLGLKVVLKISIMTSILYFIGFCFGMLLSLSIAKIEVPESFFSHKISTIFLIVTLIGLILILWQIYSDYSSVDGRLLRCQRLNLREVQCFNRVVSDYGEKLKPDLCQIIKPPYKRYLCFDTLAIARNDINLCYDKAVPASKEASLSGAHCHEAILKSADMPLEQCSKISDQNDKGNCIWEFVNFVASFNTMEDIINAEKWCQEIVPIPRKAACLGSLGKKAANFSKEYALRLCEESSISPLGQAGYCFLEVAYITGDNRICEKTNDQSFCLYKLKRFPVNSS